MPPRTGLRAQPFLAHQSGHTVFVAGFAGLSEILVDLTIAIHAASLEPSMFDQPQQTVSIAAPLAL